jgi:hypothetical protein
MNVLRQSWHHSVRAAENSVATPRSLRTGWVDNLSVGHHEVRRDTRGGFAVSDRITPACASPIRRRLARESSSLSSALVGWVASVVSRMRAG